MTEKRYTIIEKTKTEKTEKVLPSWVDKESAKSTARIAEKYGTAQIELVLADYDEAMGKVTYDEYETIDF